MTLTTAAMFVIIRFGVAPPPTVGSITFSGRQVLAWSNGKVVWSHDFGQPTRNLTRDEISRIFQIWPLNGRRGRSTCGATATAI